MDRYVFLHQKIKELDPLSSMATQPTHPSLIKVLFYLFFKSGMNSIGWHSVLTYLRSSPIALILQAARLWYYDYYISFSFFSMVQALWFHLKVHWHGLSEEFLLSTLVIHTHYCISAQERHSRKNYSLFISRALRSHGATPQNSGDDHKLSILEYMP